MRRRTNKVDDTGHRASYDRVQLAASAEYDQNDVVCGDSREALGIKDDHEQSDEETTRNDVSIWQCRLVRLAGVTARPEHYTTH